MISYLILSLPQKVVVAAGLTNVSAEELQEANPGKLCLIDENGSVGDYLDAENILQTPPPAPGPYHEFDYDSLTWVPQTSIMWEVVRNQRGALIAASDWVILRAMDTGTPVPQAWLDYRQALRDIPETCVDPFNVTWPEIPND